MLRPVLIATAAALCATAACAQPKPPPLGVVPGIGAKPPALGFQSPGVAAPTPPTGSEGLAGKPPPLAPGEGRSEEGRTVSSGTGFVVAAGRILTNHHVAEGCSDMRARTAGGTELRARVAATDAERDLALLTVQGGDAGPPLAFRQGPPVRRGEGVVTYGFPLAGLLSSGPTLTTGDVSALAGLRDNAAQFQISAPVQAGNSGGPLLDFGGNVIGVVVSKLNAQRVAQRTGDIPQNVNFAIKGPEAVEFLRRNGVQPRMAETVPPNRGAAEVGEVAHASTLFLRCVR